MKTSDERIDEDTSFFKDFCVNGLQIPEGLKVKKAMKLGPVKDDRNLNAPRSLKIVLQVKQEKIEAFRKLRNLPLAEENHKYINVSHDC